jgi:hypothetical protein
MLVRSWRKLLPDLKKVDLQGFPNEEISKSEIFDMVYAMRSFGNINKDNVKKLLQSDVCELGFQHMTDTDTVYVTKQKCDEEGGEDKSEIRTAVRSLNSQYPTSSFSGPWGQHFVAFLLLCQTVS